MIGIVGAGKVDVQSALEMASTGLDDVHLVDTIPGLAEGEALDISHRLADAGVDVDVRGTSDLFALSGTDLVTIAAGLCLKSGTTRMDRLSRNSGIVELVAGRPPSMRLNRRS